MAGKLHIWNMALGWLGARTIAAEDENTQEAVQCRLYWDSARRQALRDYPWSFARRRAWLAALPLPSGWENEYSHAYALPADCVKVLGLRLPSGQPLTYTLAHHPAAGRQTLLTRGAEALLLYSADVENTELFDDLFAHALARKLAALTAAALLRNNSAKIKEMEELYRAALPPAREADASENPALIHRDSWLAARCGLGGALC